MNIQIGKAPSASDGSTATRAAPLPGSSKSAVAEQAAPPPPAASSPPAQPTNLEAARKIASQINEYLKSSSSGVEFSVDSESSKVVVRVVDSETKAVIRQIPSEDMLAISRSMDKMTGLLIQQKA